MELDLFGEPVSKVPIPLARKEFVELKKEEALPDNPPTLPINFKERPIDYIVKEAVPGGVRTTIWFK